MKFKKFLRNINYHIVVRSIFQNNSQSGNSLIVKTYGNLLLPEALSIKACKRYFKKPYK